MMLHELRTLTGPVAAGMLLGGLFFGGLWLTIRWSIASSAVAFLFLGSLLLRTTIVLIGFYAVVGGDWSRLVAALMGFVIARITLTLFLGAPHAP